MRFANFVTSELKKGGWFEQKKKEKIEVSVSVKDTEIIKNLIQLLEKHKAELPKELKQELKNLVCGKEDNGI